MRPDNSGWFLCHATGKLSSGSQVLAGPLPSSPLTSRLRGEVCAYSKRVFVCLCVCDQGLQSDLRFGQFCTSFILPWHKICSWVLTPNNHISSESLPASFLSDNRGPGVVGWACRRNYSPGALASPPYPVSPLPAPLHPTLLLSCIWYHSASPIVFSWLKLLRDVYWRRGWNKASTSYILE